MGLLYRTHEYLRSVIGTALLEASQFAHVPESAVWDFLDKDVEKMARRVLVLLGSADGATRKSIQVWAYQPDTTVYRCEQAFGTLCPVCLCPAMPANRYEDDPSYEALPGYLYLFREYGQRCHVECRSIGQTIERICASASSCDSSTFAFFRKVTDVIAKYGRPPLRFNPRTNTDPAGRPYFSMRMSLDEIVDDDIASA